MFEFFECLSYLARLGAFSFLLGRLLAKKDIPWERLQITLIDSKKADDFYRLIKVGRWQKKVPDMSKIFTRIMPQKKITKDYRRLLPTMIKETYIAEIVHIWLMFFGFKCCRIWKGLGGIIISVINVFGNLPFVIIQRYNRPRLIRLYERINAAQTTEQGEKLYENTDTELQHRTGS